MVRNVKNEGMSFVEILVSMVILSIVVLVMTNVLVTSTRSHSSASSEDAGDMLALEKLAELQNHVIPAKSDSDNVSKDNQDYKRVWLIDDASTPPRVTVTVTWTDLSDNKEDASVIGYIDSDNTCPDITSATTGSNSGPYNMKFMRDKDGDGTEEDLENHDVYSQPVVLAHSLLARVDVKDDNITASHIEDILSYEITSLNADSMFYLEGNILKNAKPLAATNSYSIDVKVTDCHGEYIKGNFEVIVKENTFEVFEKNFEIDESTPSHPTTLPYELGKIYASEVVAGGWTIVSDGGITSLSIVGDITETFATISINEELSHEDGHKIAFEIKGNNGSVDSTAICTLYVNDIPELPTSIALESNTSMIPNDLNKGKIVDTLIIFDEDNGEHNYLFSTITKKNGVELDSTLFEVFSYATGKHKLRTKASNTDLQKNTGIHTVTINLTDINKGAGADATMSETFSINLDGPALFDCNSTEVTEYTYMSGAGTKQYSVGQKIFLLTVSNKNVYKCLTDGIWNNQAILAPSDWEYIGKCKN